MMFRASSERSEAYLRNDEIHRFAQHDSPFIHSLLALYHGGSTPDRLGDPTPSGY
jgi:hypothetical protein